MMASTLAVVKKPYPMNAVETWSDSHAAGMAASGI